MAPRPEFQNCWSSALQWAVGFPFPPSPPPRPPHTLWETNRWFSAWSSTRSQFPNLNTFCKMCLYVVWSVAGNGEWEDCVKTPSNDPIISSGGERSLSPWCDLKAICVGPFTEKYLKLEIPWKLIKNNNLVTKCWYPTSKSRAFNQPRKGHRRLSNFTFSTLS